MMAIPSFLYLLSGIIIVFAAVQRVRSRRNQKTLKACSVYRDIPPYDGDWRCQEPLKIRNFKDVYHLTMGLQTCSLPDLVLMDDSYEAKMQLRRKLIQDNHDDVIGFNPVARDAVLELYTWLFTEYLPQRFPTAFKRIQRIGPKGASEVVQNLVNNEMIPIHPAMDAKACLTTIGRHIDCEFAILLPTANSESRPFRAEPSAVSGTIYHLHAFVLVFPSGFNTAHKLGMSLTEIHGPVPGYSTKLEKSMNRYFANLPFGKVVQRSNWSISTDSVLFKLKDMHTDIRTASAEQNASPSRVDKEKGRVVKMAPATHEPSAEEIQNWQGASKQIDPNKCSLRMERQTLHRLEKTGALVFGFKTFLEPLSQLKQEGSGPQLIEALRSLPRGSVPAMDVYKDGVIWREPLIEYLTD